MLEVICVRLYVLYSVVWHQHHPLKYKKQTKTKQNNFLLPSQITDEKPISHFC